jgi:hypothetical protein
MSCANSPGEGAGAAYNTSTTLTDVSAAPQYMSQTYGAMYVGQRWRLTAHGIFSTTSTPTLLLGFYYGGVAGTALAATAATTTGSAAAAWPWRLELLMSVRSLGSSGTVWCQGWVDFPTSLTALTRTAIPLTNAQLVTVNTTTNSALTTGAQWGTSSASNTLTCEDMIIEQLN